MRKGFFWGGEGGGRGGGEGEGGGFGLERGNGYGCLINSLKPKPKPH